MYISRLFQFESEFLQQFYLSAPIFFYIDSFMLCNYQKKKKKLISFLLWK